jgi:hypothetical protein
MIVSQSPVTGVAEPSFDYPETTIALPSPLGKGGLTTDQERVRPHACASDRRLPLSAFVWLRSVAPPGLEFSRRSNAIMYIVKESSRFHPSPSQSRQIKPSRKKTKWGVPLPSTGHSPAFHVLFLPTFPPGDNVLVKTPQKLGNPLKI